MSEEATTETTNDAATQSDPSELPSDLDSRLCDAETELVCAGFFELAAAVAEARAIFDEQAERARYLLSAPVLSSLDGSPL